MERIKQAVETAWMNKDHSILILWEGELSEHDKWEYGQVDWKKEQYVYKYCWKGDRANGISSTRVVKTIPLPAVFIIWNSDGMTLYEKRVDEWRKTIIE